MHMHTFYLIISSFYLIIMTFYLIFMTYHGDIFIFKIHLYFSLTGGMGFHTNIIFYKLQYIG